MARGLAATYTRILDCVSEMVSVLLAVVGLVRIMVAMGEAGLEWHGERQQLI